MLDLTPWLDPLDGDNPSGESLRDHPSFHEIERLMESRVEVTRDERNNPVAQVTLPIDWAAVLERSEELRRHGRDLRLLVIVARAHANERGLAGLADGLTLIARTLEAHWDTLHPELRPAAQPRDAALRRINALRQLTDRDGLLGDLAGRTFVAVRGVDPVTGRDLERSMLNVNEALNEAPAMATEADKAELAAAHDRLLDRVNRACKSQAEAAPAETAALAAEARAAIAAVEAVEMALGVHLGGGSERVLQDLGQFLTRTAASLERVSAPRPAAESTAPSAAPAVATASEGASMVARQAPAAIPDRLSSREEVIACLDRIIEFYDRTEPASPVPFLARRMRRMVPMDFLELMEDLAPSGLKEFRSLAGLGDDKKAARTQGEKT